MPNAKLTVAAQTSDHADQRCFELIGTIDVEASAVLDTMVSLPADCRRVLLNFARVQRVNSMGLAQLLKLFEHWQERQVEIQIAQANRMIGVLFKMTGLAGYLIGDTGQSTSASIAVDNAMAGPQQIDLGIGATLARPAARNPEYQQSPSAQTSAVSTPASSGVAGKLKLLVSVQSSQQMHGWYFFNTYLQRQLGREVHMELVHGPFNDSHLQDKQMDIVFSKPFEAVRLNLQQQYQAIMRPSDQCDEVTLLARSDDPRQSLLEFQGGKVVTATQANFVYLLGRFLLEEDEAALADMDYQFVGCDIKSLQSLIKGAADIVFLLSDSYRGLSGLTKSKLRVIDQSETQFAFHMLSVAPNCLELAPAISQLLLDMSLNNQGRQVLADLGIPGWSKPTADEINMLTMLYKRYSH